jgi:hypothetical protein
MPAGGVWRQWLSWRGSNDRPARRALLPASGLEIVRPEAAENRVGALGGQLVLADLAGNTRRHPGRRSPIGGELDALEARAETAAHDHGIPNVFAVSRRIGREALGQDALTPRFVGSAVLQVMVAVRLVFRVTGARRVTPPGQIAFCTGSIRQVSQNRGRLHASPDRYRSRVRALQILLIRAGVWCAGCRATGWRVLSGCGGREQGGDHGLCRESAVVFW